MSHGPIYRVLFLKCPKCGEEDLFCNKHVYQFKGFFDMPDKCPNCNQDFQIEPGFYYGAMYASYALTIAITVAVFTIMAIFEIFSIVSFLIADVIALIITLPYLVKVSRSLWLMLMVKPNKNNSYHSS